MENLRSKFEQNKKALSVSLLAVFVWGLLAHGYAFVGDNFTHDSLAEFNAAINGNQFKMGSGRWFVPIYRAIFRTNLTLPWLDGILALIWIGLAVFLVTRIFQVESKALIFLTAGIFTVNISVIATAATYSHDLDSDMLALLFAVAAVYCWKNVRWGTLAGAGFVTLVLGIYQSYLSVVIVLVMFVCIQAILKEERFKDVFRKGLKAVGMILMGGAVYYGVMRISLWITGGNLSSGDYNSLDMMLTLTPGTLCTYTVGAYLDCFDRLLNVVSPYPAAAVWAMTILLGGVALISAVAGILRKQVRLLEKVLCLGLLCLLPLGMNITYVLSCKNVHDLMMFGIWLSYLLALLLTDWLVRFVKENKPGLCRKIGKWVNLPKWISMAVVFVLIYGNVQTANAVYLKKDLEQDAYLSLMTRVLSTVEQKDGYIQGQTPVAFVGLSDQVEPVKGMEKYSSLIGLEGTGPIIRENIMFYEAYFDYILLNPIELAEYYTWMDLQTDPVVADMPAYPADGSVEFVDDVLVVKLGTPIIDD